MPAEHSIHVLEFAAPVEVENVPGRHDSQRALLVRLQGRVRNAPTGHTRQGRQTVSCEELQAENIKDSSLKLQTVQTVQFATISLTIQNASQCCPLAPMQCPICVLPDQHNLLDMNMFTKIDLCKHAE